MDRIDVKSKPQAVLTESRGKFSTTCLGGAASTTISRRAGGGLQQVAAVRDAIEPATDGYRLSDSESKCFLQIVEATARITRHFELFQLAQNELQHFVPHKILISAWGDFDGSKLKLDVISAIPGVRTGKLSDCGLELTLKAAFARWIAGGRRPLVLNNAATAPLTDSACDCALHSAMQSMRSVLVHGIRNERDDLDSLYVALNPVSIAGARSVERLSPLIDSLFAQVDVAFRKVAALKYVGIAGAESSPRRADALSAREQEIVHWITDGKTNAEIAAILDISSFTVKNHVQRIFRKLGVSNRTEAVARFHLGN